MHVLESVPKVYLEFMSQIPNSTLSTQYILTLFKNVFPFIVTLYLWLRLVKCLALHYHSLHHHSYLFKVLIKLLFSLHYGKLHLKIWPGFPLSCDNFQRDLGETNLIFHCVTFQRKKQVGWLLFFSMPAEFNLTSWFVIQEVLIQGLNSLLS